jgi:hypothetical protein
MFDIGFQWPFITAGGFAFVAFLLSLKSQSQAQPVAAFNARHEP